MRYIEKQDSPECLELWKAEQKLSGLKLFYDDFPNKSLLNETLRSEQRYICCYCQRRIDHFQGDLQYGAHNEHLYPENIAEDAMSVKLQVEYSNIYACCIDSRGYEKHLQYCGEAKSNKRIPHLIQHPKCSDYFRYNVLGEIIPNGDYARWEDYKSKEAELTGSIYDAFLCIKILNLNCLTLVTYRYTILQIFMTLISQWPADKLEKFISSYEAAKEYQELLDMKLQYMRERLRSLR